MQKFKIGDRVRSNKDYHWSKDWQNVKITSQNAFGFVITNEYGDVGQMHIQSDWSLIEETEMQKIEVGSKWLHNFRRKGEIVTVVHVTEMHVAYEFSDGSIGVDTPENFAKHTPYKEPKTVVGYVAVLKDVESDELMFDSDVHESEENAKEDFDFFYRSGGETKLVKIVKIEYTEGE